MYDEGLAALGTPSTHNFAVGPGSEEMTAAYNKGVTPVFMNHLVPDPERSSEEGRPMFKNEEIAILFVAGDPNNRVPIEMRVAQERFPTHYEKWKSKQEERHISGTPLRSWAALSAQEVAEFEALAIYNVEGLANLADTNISRHPSLRAYREKAKAYIATAKDSAASVKLAAENEVLRRDIDDLRNQVAKLAAQAENHKKR
jgi:hypothetical protein